MRFCTQVALVVVACKHTLTRLSLGVLYCHTSLHRTVLSHPPFASNASSRHRKGPRKKDHDAERFGCVRYKLSTPNQSSAASISGVEGAGPSPQQAVAQLHARKVLPFTFATSAHVTTVLSNRTQRS